MHSLSWPPIRPLRLESRGFHVPGISIRILVRFMRIARTFLAPHMAAGRAHLRTRRKHRLARVAPSADPLDNLFPNKILSARARGHNQRRGWVARQLEMRRNRERTRLPGANLCNPGPGNARLLIVVCFAGWWEARAFLASGVLAVDADLLWAEGGFAAVAGAVDAHADWFGYSSELDVRWGFPFTRFEGEAVFGEDGARFFLLDGAVVGHHGWFRGDIWFGLRRGCGCSWWTVAIKGDLVSSLCLVWVSHILS